MHRDPPPGTTGDDVSNGPQSVDGLKRSVANLSPEGKQSVVTTVLRDLSPEATQDVAAEAVRSPPPEAKKEAAVTAAQALSPEDKEDIIGRLQGPTQRTADRIWQLIVG